MFDNLLIHGLALGAQPMLADEIARMTERALNLGACGIELVYWPGPGNIPAKDAAKAITKAGGTRASLCAFHPKGDQFGDPLSPDPMTKDLALEHLKAAIRYADTMRHNGLRISTVDGPLGFVLGEQGYGSCAQDRLVAFMQEAAETASLHGINLALERLQKSEDGVIQTASALAHLLDRINCPHVGAHDDSFHAEKNGTSADESIRTLGKHLKHYHANGLGEDKFNDGRIPCGCHEYRLEDRVVNDRINWRKVSLALAELRQPADSILICLEPFCEAACVAIPDLRTGVVPVTSDEQIRDSIRHLMDVGMLRRA